MSASSPGFGWTKIDGAVLEALYRGGCRQVFIGVEAVVDDLLDALVKGYSGAVALDRLRRLAEFADEGTPAFTKFGSSAVGVLEPLFPQGPPLDSFRYLTTVQERPDQRERFALWETIEAITCPGRAATTVSAAGPGPGIYD